MRYDIEPCEHCGAEYLRSHRLTQRQKEMGLESIANGVWISELPLSRIHEVLVAVIPSRHERPSDRFINHACPTVRAAFWAHPMVVPTVDNHLSTEHFEVRKALWNREVLAEPLREMLREEFGEVRS